MDVFIELWRTYPWAVDLALYFFVFAAAARVSFARIFPGHEGKTLAIAIGLVLAASLTAAQHTFGFSLETLGPIAVTLLCLVLFIVAYRLLKHSQLPPWLTVSFATIFAVALFKLALPKYTERFAQDNPGIVFFALCILLVWIWYSASAGAEHVIRRMPGFGLQRFHVAPSERMLTKEQHYAKNKLLKETKKEIKEDSEIGTELSRATHLLERDGLTPHTTPKIRELLKKASETTRTVEEQCTKLRETDQALENFDLKWFRRMRHANLGQLTPAQQEIMRNSIREERRRLHVEEELKKLEVATAHQIRALESSIEKAQENLAASNAAGALGWLNQAIGAEQKLLETQKELLRWEKLLVRLIKKQRSALHKR